jgi:hypothetical protein
MALPSVFNPSTTQKHLERLEKLSQSSAAQWGKMNSAQMLAHLNVTYDLAYEKTITHPNFFTKLMLKLFVKGIVTSEKSYPKNSRTAPEFIIADARDFEKEKAILINNIKDTEAKGVAFFEGRKSQAFGVLTSQEWSNQLYKHIEHHFEQFAI